MSFVFNFFSRLLSVARQVVEAFVSLVSANEVPSELPRLTAEFVRDCRPIDLRREVVRFIPEALRSLGGAATRAELLRRTCDVAGIPQDARDVTRYHRRPASDDTAIGYAFDWACQWLQGYRVLVGADHDRWYLTTESLGMPEAYSRSFAFGESVYRNQLHLDRVRREDHRARSRSIAATTVPASAADLAVLRPAG